LVAITDTSALIMLGAQGELTHQAEATFATARHALVDSVKVLQLNPGPNGPSPNEGRLSPEDLQRIRRIVAEAGVALDPRLMSVERVGQVRASYENQVAAISSYLLMGLPPGVPEDGARYNWKSAIQSHSASTFTVSDPFIDDDDHVEDRSA
jgi:hypothetical protein